MCVCVCVCVFVCVGLTPKQLSTSTDLHSDLSICKSQALFLLDTYVAAVDHMHVKLNEKNEFLNMCLPWQCT